MYHAGRTALVLITGYEDATIPMQFSENESESSVIEYVLNAVWTVVDHIYVAFDYEPNLKLVESIAPFGVKIIVSKDREDMVSIMATGLQAVKSELCLVISGNMPFVKPNVIFALFEAARGYDVAIPRWPDGRIDPLLAVYRCKSFLRVVEQNLDAKDPADVIDNLYAVRYVDIDKELRQLDPDLNSFFKVKTSEDVEEARRIATMLTY